MKLLAPALRELARMLARIGQRLRLVLEERKLAKLEAALGLLGWQQAEYDPATQQHADRLTAYEREQARLSNESAALGLAIREIEEQREAKRCELEETAAVAIEKEQPSAASEAELAELATTRRKEIKGLEARASVIERELAAAEERYRQRVLEEAPAEELLDLRKVILALPRERAEWQARLVEVTRDVAAMEALLASLRSARDAFEMRDAALVQEITARLRAKQKIEKQSEALERAKADPYREIGRALADEGIAPRNQPGALSAVLAQRQVISDQEAFVAGSRAASAAENRALLRNSWIALAVVLMSLAAVALVVASL